MQKRLKKVKMPVLKACNCVLAYTEESLPGSDLQVDFGTEKQKAEQNGLLTGERLRGVMKRRNYYAAKTVFPFVASFIDKSLSFVER